MTNPDAGSPLRQRMIEDMVARKLVPNTQRGHVFACRQFAAYLGRVRGFQSHRRSAPFASDVELLRDSDGIVVDAEAGGFSGISWRYWRERVAAKPT